MKIALSQREIGSLAYVRLGEIVASYRAENPATMLKRIEAITLLCQQMAEHGVTQDDNAPPAKKIELEISQDDLSQLVHTRIQEARRAFLSVPRVRTVADLKRVIELQKQLVASKPVASKAA
jgi:hypothetical protein